MFKSLSSVKVLGEIKSIEYIFGSCMSDLNGNLNRLENVNCFLSQVDAKAVNPSRPDPAQKEKNNLYFYFHTSLWCLKRFYEDFKGLHKTS